MEIFDNREYNKTIFRFCNVTQPRRDCKWKFYSNGRVSMHREVTRHLTKGQEVLYEPTLGLFAIPSVAQRCLANTYFIGVEMVRPLGERIS